MTEEKIKRINELAKKHRDNTITEQEKAERAALHREYAEHMKNNLRAQLKNVRIVDKDGKISELKPKK